MGILLSLAECSEGIQQHKLLILQLELLLVGEVGLLYIEAQGAVRRARGY